jgi:hypothetical protein
VRECEQATKALMRAELSRMSYRRAIPRPSSEGGRSERNGNDTRCLRIIAYSDRFSEPGVSGN